MALMLFGPRAHVHKFPNTAEGWMDWMGHLGRTAVSLHEALLKLQSTYSTVPESSIKAGLGGLLARLS